MKRTSTKITSILSMVLTALVIVSLSLSSCKKDKDDEPAPTPTPNTNVVNNATTLSSAISIPGATRVSGDVPVPSNPSGPNIIAGTPTVVVTPNSSFDASAAVNDSAYLFRIYFQIDGTDEHFMIKFDSSGNIVGKRQPLRYYNWTVNLSSNSSIGSSFDAYGNAWGYSSYDPGGLANNQLWTPPWQIHVSVVKTGLGDLTVTLTWDNTNDIDLWLIEPDGTKIYYSNTTSSSGGELDYDNQTGYGPENIFYSGTPPTGTYKAYVHFYSDNAYAPSNWTVKIKNGSNNTTYNGILSSEGDSTLVATFTR